MRNPTRIFFTRSAVPVMLFICALLFAGPVWAEDPDGQITKEKGTEPDIDVVVTADRVETASTKIPAYVTVITAAELKSKGVQTVVEALQELAGVSFRSTSGNPARAQISMRGFGENSFGRVLILLDGRRLNQPDMAGINWLQIPIENVERIEVVRGGNSVLYGDYAVGGVVNIITKKGGKETKADAFAAGGSFLDNQQRLGISGMIGPFDLVVNAEHTGTDGYRDHSAFESVGAGFELGTDISDRVYGSLKSSYEWLSCELPGDLSKAQMDDDPTQSQAKYANDNTENHTLNNMLSIKALFSDWGELHTDLYYNLKIMADNIPSNFTPTYNNKYLHSFGALPRFTLTFPFLGMDDRTTLGADLSWDIYDFNRFTDSARDNKDYETMITKDSYGFHINNELSPIDFLHIKAGMRYELSRVVVDTLVGTSIDGEKFQHAFVWNAGIVWNFLPDSKLYARMDTVFRYPFIDEQVIYSGYWPDEFNKDLKPEHGYNIETGTQLSLFDKAVTVNLNGFYLVMEDEIAPDFIAQKNVNLDKTERIGGEIGVKLSLADFIVLTGNYTYTHAIFLTGENAGKFVPLVPEHNAFAELTLKLPFGFSLGTSLHYRGECYSGGDVGNTLEKMDAYFLLNGFVKFVPAFISDKLQIMLQLENILNQNYCTFVYYAYSYYPEPGFNWKISVSYSLEL